MTRPLVMIVEDNPITRKMVTFTLESNGFAVVDAPDAATALRAFAEQTPALVLQDLMLPDLDGVELVRRLRALPGGAEVPILAFSGMLSKGDEARFSSAGFDDLIAKPVEPSRLLQIVRAHLPGDEPVAPPATRRKLVLADDDGVQRKLSAFRLGKAGYDVVAATDGLDALERAREVLPDVIVSDVLMPRLDGFGLCVAVRNDPVLAGTPIVLVTNSYLETADKELARRAGANELILRTPELREVLAVIENLARAEPGAAPPPPGPPAVDVVRDPDVERERMQRVMKQLERHVALNAGANQRVALLSAELSVLSAISEAVATQHDTEAALHQALAACFDAGGISVGALYLLERDGRRVLRFGADGGAAEELATFYGRPDLLTAAIQQQTLLALPSDALPATDAAAVLARAGASSLLLAPLGHQGEPLGALLMVSSTTDLQAEDRRVFALAVAGQISLALALARAFAAKDASERAARAQADLLHSILESMADGVVVSDATGAITSWNPAAEAILGMRALAVEWMTRGGTFSADQVTPLPREQHPLARAQRGESVDRTELFVRDEGKDGAWLSMSARPLRDETGATCGGVAVFRDVTAEKQAAAQLMVSDRMASLGSLAAGVAHEINNPLAAVLGNLDLALRDVEALAAQGGVPLRELPEEIADARHAADRVRQIVRDLKLFSRAEEDKRGPVDVERVLESSLRMAWTEIRHRARLTRAYGQVPAVDANEARLGQVFLNLIVNAAQAIPEGRAMMNEIKVSTVQVGDHVRVEISDTGHGMPPEVKARLFTPFFTTKPAGVGTGLGLAICKRLLVAIGGEIAVDSEVGKGTTFAVTLPAVPAATAVGRDAAAPAVPQARRRGRVLVVDDESAIGAYAQRALGREHDVVALTDAAEAVRRIAGGERFDVILCDLMMPTVTGLDLHTELATIAPDQAAAIVFITGGVFTPRTSAALNRLTNPRLEKPFDLETLRRLVNDRVFS
jgi:PAS domain S-box-containing protein